MLTEKQISQGKENLKKGKKTQFNGERAVEMGKKSAKARQKKAEERKEQESFQKIAQRIMNMPLYKGKPVDANDIQSLAEAKGQNLPIKWAIVIAQAINAINGNKGAAEFMRDTAGEKPVEKQEMNVRTIDKSLEEMEAYFNDKRTGI